MFLRSIPRRAFQSSLVPFLPLALLLALSGCFETAYSLGPREQAAVDPAYCGDWVVKDRDNPTESSNVRIVIRNLDGRQYYVEWIEAGKDGEPDKSQRMLGFTADVKGTTFAHLRDLPADGSIPDKHLVMRVGVRDGTLTLRNLSKEFFEGRAIASDADLRRIVEENLDNEAMYDEGVVTATRAG